MVVNNPGSNDNRVVRAAEASSKAGYDVHVVGLGTPDYPDEEMINGVVYHRARLDSDSLSLTLDTFPDYIQLELLHKWMDRQKKTVQNKIIKYEKNIQIKNDKKKRSILFSIGNAFSNAVKILSNYLILLDYIDSYLFKCKKIYRSIKERMRRSDRIRNSYFNRIRNVTLFKLRRLYFKIRRGYFGIRKLFFILYRPVSRFTVRLSYRIKQRSSNLIHDLKKINADTLKSKFIFFVKKKNFFQLPGKLIKLYRNNDYQPSIQQGRYTIAFYPILVDLDADVYYAHELSTLNVCSLVAGEKDAKLVYDSHELEPHRNALWNDGERLFWTKREKRLIEKADEVITVSFSLANELMKMYGLNRVTVIRNTSPLAFKPADIDLRSSLGLAREVPLLVFVGLVSYNRGLDLLIESLARLPGYHLATVGPVNRKIYDEILQQSKRLGVGERFHAHPKVKYNQLVNFLGTADISVIPFKNTCLSHYCLLPNKLFESIFAGLPVVTSDFPDLHLFIEETHTGAVFNPDDIDDLIQKIKYVYKNRDKLMSPAKRDALRRRYSYEREALKLYSLFKRLEIPAPDRGVKYN